MCLPCRPLSCGRCYLLGGITPHSSSISIDFVPSPYISVYLWFERKLSPGRFWSRTWSPGELNYDFYDLSNIRTGWQDRPSIMASNIIHHSAHTQLSEEEIVGATLREVDEFIPGASQVRLLHSRVHRIPMAIPAPHPGTEQVRPASRTHFHGLFLAGDWTRTELPCCMEGAVRSGFLAAEEILTAVGKARPLALKPREPSGIAGIVHRLLAHTVGAAGTDRRLDVSASPMAAGGPLHPDAPTHPHRCGATLRAARS